MTRGKWWSHPECDRAELDDKCEPCREWALGRVTAALDAAAEAEAWEAFRDRC